MGKVILRNLVAHPVGYEFTKTSDPINMEEIVEALAHHPILSIVYEGDASVKPSAPFRGVMQKPPYYHP
jgi:hypothetical protein